MNLTNFLKQTDSLTAKYTAEQLASFIHDVARVLPEKHRADFLKRLKEVDTVGQDAQEKRDRCSVPTIDSAYEAIRENFETIESGEVSISSEYNEEYDDWYGGEELFYEDPEDIGGMLQTACDFIHTCMDIEEYEKGLEIGESFFALQISCYNIALDTLYCGYHAVPMKKRPETLYGSDTSAVNYLRAVLNGFDKAEDRENLSRVMRKFDLGQSASWEYGEGGSGSERAENKPGRNIHLSILFLDGQFDEVLTHGLNQSKPLGWSGTFMKQGMAMFLLALHEGNWNGIGIRKNWRKEQQGSWRQTGEIIMGNAQLILRHWER